jgi:catalase
MVASQLLAVLAIYSHLTYATCPLMGSEAQDLPANHPVVRRDDSIPTSTEEHLSQFYIDDSDAYMTSDAGVPLSDQNALKAGERGPTLLEDFINRQKVRATTSEPTLLLTTYIRLCTSTMSVFQREVWSAGLCQWHC